MEEDDIALVCNMELQQSLRHLSDNTKLDTPDMD